MDSRYEVVYIDKFTDIVEAEIARKQLQQRFHMSDGVLQSLSCGKPVVIKKGVDLEEAERYEKAIKDSGGVCWIQKMSEDGAHHERRHNERRLNLDRRSEYRGSSIQPDRRANCGRRTSDNNSKH
ncbi:MAG: hypothetical protein AseanaTS_13620 [Candidatus Pelagadaptatus aseana]|uniref:hypothetical protein n=1 Tax=Candidatus Pelagadaptatus aseana TaxID=3120508 RepID=UPI0039B32EA7